MQSKNEFVGDKIKAYRKRRKWTQEDLAERLGVKGNTISSYENGKIEIPYSKLEKIAIIFEVKTNDLLPVDEKQDNISEYMQEAKSKLNEDQLNLFEQLLKKSLTLTDSERENFFKNVRFMIQFLDNDKQ